MQIMASGCQLWGSTAQPIPRGVRVGCTILCACLARLGSQIVSIVLSAFVKAALGTSVFGDSLLPLAAQAVWKYSLSWIHLRCLISRRLHLEPEKESEITVCSFTFFPVTYSWLCGVYGSSVAGRVIPSHPWSCHIPVLTICFFPPHSFLPRCLLAASCYPPVFYGSSITPEMLGCAPIQQELRRE